MAAVSAASEPILFEGLILPYFCLYLVSACKINKKTQTYNTFATNLQQKPIRIDKISKNPQTHYLQIITDYQAVSILTIFKLMFVV